MRVCDAVSCQGFPCEGVDHAGYRVPAIDLDPDAVRVLLISEAAAPDPADDYYAMSMDADSAERVPLFEQTTVLAFRDAGADVESIGDILGLGVYLTTAIKCAKIGTGIKAGPVNACANLLKVEMELFPNLCSLLLMGDVAIKAVNRVARISGEPRVIPTGSTYKIRGVEAVYRDIRAFPSYLQAGPSFFIEKSKRRMIAEDIAAALRVADGRG